MKERIFLCALGMIILVASSLPMGIGTVNMPAETGDWVIQSGETVTVTDQDITLTGNLTIYGTLTFENVTLRMNLSKDGDYAILVKAGGKFYVYNSTITSVNISNSFGFYVFNNATLEMKYSLLSYCGFPPGAVGLNFYPMGLHIESNNVLLVKNTISKGYYGIYVISSNPKIEGNVIEKNWYGIYATDSTPTIKDNFISNDRGIFLSKSNAIITGNEITQAYSGSGIGILLSLCNPEVKFNKISSGYIGIYMQGSSPNVIGNIIEKNWQAGIKISGDNSGGGGGSVSKPIIENNTIRYNGYAIQSYSSEPKIVSNNVYENNEGISMREGGGEIINNTIEKSKSQNYGYGIYSSNSNLLIKENRIKNNAFSGIFIAKMLPKLLNNDITNNKYGLAFADGFFSLVNYTINGNKDADVYLIDKLPDHRASTPATVDLVNVTFSSAKVGDGSSILKVYWYVDVYVYFESNSEPAGGADVKIYEKNSDTPYYKGTTDSSGLVKLIKVMEYSMSATGKNEKTPHNITAEANGKKNWTVSEIRKNSVFHIPLDNVPPLLKIISPKDGYLTNRSEVEI
ncbi:MAG: right-handed parallel beta-helix repeat-containing protein, partial [Candidatus Thermoplasmatota archaeon]